MPRRRRLEDTGDQWATSNNKYGAFACPSSPPRRKPENEISIHSPKNLVESHSAPVLVGSEYEARSFRSQQQVANNALPPILNRAVSQPQDFLMPCASWDRDLYSYQKGYQDGLEMASGRRKFEELYRARHDAIHMLMQGYDPLPPQPRLLPPFRHLAAGQF